MIPEPDKIRQYLQDALGVTISPAKWPVEGRLPLFLRNEYYYYEAEILGLRCLLMADHSDKGLAPATIRKHMEHLHSKWEGEIIYVRAQMDAYRRRGLIEQKVSFIVPGNQLYLPVLGIDLREHFRRLRRISPTLSPSSQVILLRTLLRGEGLVHTTAELTEQLGYTKMTMSRAFNELEAEDLADISMQGRQRCLRFKVSRKDLWHKALPLLRSPVKRRQHVRLTSMNRVGPVAGLSALAKYTMLAAPSIPTVATSARRWKAFQERDDFVKTTADDPESHELELWSYDPSLLCDGKIVDRLSLFLSLRDNKDERVEVAVEEMMEAVLW